jgi:uncharacterized protein (TIGR02217 family)
MENFINHRLSARASKEFRRVNNGKSDITTLDNGEDIVNARWKYKKMRYYASYALLGDMAQQELTAAFYAANAMLMLFRFRDAGDFLVDKSPIATTVGEVTSVQLTKRYSFGPAYADRLIQAIAACTVYEADGVTPVDVAVDTELGLVTPAAPWNGGEVWSGRFDVWVRFASDEFDMTMHQIDIATTDVELMEGRARR